MIINLIKTISFIPAILITLNLNASPNFPKEVECDLIEENKILVSEINFQLVDITQQLQEESKALIEKEIEEQGRELNKRFNHKEEFRSETVYSE